MNGGRLTGLGPEIGPDARLVVLGSFPGVASLQAAEYYGHPRNQFWSILGAIWSLDLPSMAYPHRLAALRTRRVGLWDVYASCRRQGSLDSAIEEPVLNDLAILRRRAPGLQAIAHHGGESARAMPLTRGLGVQVHRLPSTSPANASWSFECKLEAWRAVFVASGVA